MKKPLPVQAASKARAVSAMALSSPDRAAAMSTTVVDWIYASDGHDLARVYPAQNDDWAEEHAALQQPAATVSEDLVRSYQVVVDVALLDGTDPRLDIGDFSVRTWEHADETDLGDLAVAESGNLISGSVSRLDDPHDHFKFTLSQRRDVQLSLSGSDGQAAIILEDHARAPAGEDDRAASGLRRIGCAPVEERKEPDDRCSTWPYRRADCVYRLTKWALSG